MGQYSWFFKRCTPAPGNIEIKTVYTYDKNGNLEKLTTDNAYTTANTTDTHDKTYLYNANDLLKEKVLKIQQIAVLD
jgi:hypothetical protein